MVDDPLDSGLGGELGEVRMAPLTGVTTAASLSGLLRRMEGRGEPGTVLSASERGPGMMGVMRAGVMVAGPVSVAPELGLAEELSPVEITHYTLSSRDLVSCLPGAGSVVMVTLLCPDSPPAPRPASYISVVWLKLGMAMAGATTALETVRFTGLAWLLPVSLQQILELTTFQF